METLVLKSLSKLRQACTRSHREVRDTIDRAHAKVTQGSAQGGTLDVPFEPFLLACLTRSAKLVAVALDCLEKFLAFGYLREAGVAISAGVRRRLVQRAAAAASSSSSGAGRRPGFGLGSGTGAKHGTNGTNSGLSAALTATPLSSDCNVMDGQGAQGGSAGSGDESVRVIDCIVDVACDCNDHPDDNVQIQVLRVLLTAVTTPTCEVHEQTLLRAVRACYHVHLVSKSAMNRTVAKATLQQILSIVFQRMETFDRRVEQETSVTLLASLQQQELERQRRHGKEEKEHEQEDVEQGVDATRDVDRDTIGQLQRVETMAAMYPSVSAVLQLPYGPARSKRPAISSATTSETVEMASSRSQQAAFSAAFPSVLHKDAFLLFRSLCRISMRSVADDSPTATDVSTSATGKTGDGANPEDPFAFQSMILSLELVKDVLQNAGPSFRQGDWSVHVIRQYLCQSLLQNCTSNYTKIVSLSLQVFLVLLHNFKRHLKTELDIFITSVFLRLLQSENASFEHKLLVLEALRAICDDPSTIGEIFLNYDCDWNHNDLFKQIVHALAKTAKGGCYQDAAAQQYAASLSNSARIKMLQQDAALALKGLECLTATAASLKKAANFVEIERQFSSQRDENEKSPEDENGEDEDNVAPPDLVPIISSTMSAVEAFKSKKKRQEEMATGILKFNVKPSAGIAYLVAHGHMGEGSPRDVAAFLHAHNNKLDKTMVGDYLGNGVHYQGGFCVQVLHEYVDMMEFAGLEIDVAIRHFLAGFRLPGESQKIDRMMEKFAERFFSSCPPGLFPSADTAFILAFSIIMLQTDLHNPSIAEEKKMDKAGFLRNNRGINDGKDLPEEYMSAIFDRIKATPISLKEDDDFRGRRGGASTAASSLFGASGAATDRLRRDAYIKERQSMVRQSEALFKRRAPPSSREQRQLSSRSGQLSASTTPSSPASSTLQQNSGAASTLTTPDPSLSTFQEVSGYTERSHVRPMFDTLWAPLLAVCSVTFESSESAEAIQLCLDSFRHAVHLSARLDMPEERNAFVMVLAKFTALHTTHSRLMRSKNMEAIKALISISVKEGNYLSDSWHDVLQAISQLAWIQTHAQSLREHPASGSVAGDRPYTNREPSPGVGNLSSSRSNSGNIAPSFSMRGSSASSKRGGPGTSRLSPSFSYRDTGGRGNGSEPDEGQIEDENAARVLNEIDQLASDRVFSSSVLLSDQALQQFVVQLTVVSLSECSGIGSSGAAGGSPPRVFSLQKLVEVADMNMRTRSRMVWAATWQTLSRHFTTIGCHEDLTVGMYAIDSLRQLSVKFLERTELRDFNFQRLFLAPFEVIMSNATSLETRELILRCVENLVLARVSNIRSGWKTIWGVLRVAAETYAPGSEDRVVLLGFQVARGVLERHFACTVDVFIDVVDCLVAFAVCGCEEVERHMEERLTLTQLGVDSIGLLRSVCIERLATGGMIEPLTGRETTGSFSASSAPAAVAVVTKQTVLLDCEKVRVVVEDPTDDTSCASVEYQRQEAELSLETEVTELSSREVPPAALPVSSHRRGDDFAETMEETCLESSEIAVDDSIAHTRMLWPALTALSTLAADRRLDVRLAALEVLFDALETHGKKFSRGLWKSIFKDILIPLLFQLRHLEVFLEKGAHPLPKLPLPVRRNLGSQMPRYTAGKTTATLCLERLLQCFGLFYDIVGFLPEVLFLLGKFMDAGDTEEQLATASASALEITLTTYGHKFSTSDCGLIVDEVCNAMKRAEPTWIFAVLPPTHDAETASASEPDVTSSAESSAKERVPLSPASHPSAVAFDASSSPHQPSLLGMYPGVVATLGFSFAASFTRKMIGVGEVIAKRVPSRSHLAVLLTLQRLAGNVLASCQNKQLSLSVGHARLLLSCLRESFMFARKVNDSSSLRRRLRHTGWRYGMTVPSSSELPSLLPQEVLGKQQYLHVLFAILNRSVDDCGDVPIRVEEAREYMARLVQDSIEEYLVWTGSAPQQVREDGSVPADAKQRGESYASLVVAILEELVGLDSTELEHHMRWLYPLLTSLVMVPNIEVRVALSIVFNKAVRRLLQIT